MTTPSSESLNQLPTNQRRYVATSELASLKEKGLRIYEGEKGGTYVDADQEWLKGHADKGHQKVTEGYFKGLVPHPEHKPDIYEWEDGSHGPTSPAKGVNKAKDENGVAIVIERNEFHPRGGRAIPGDATEVHISLDPKSRVQAKWRNAKTGLIQRSYSKEGQAQNEADHLEHTRIHATDIQKGVDAIKDSSAEDLENDETLACLSLIADLGIRHGTDYAIHEDGFPTGLGAASLKGENVSFSEDGKTVTLDFRGKMAHPQNFSTSNEKVVRSLKAHIKGKDDFIFGTGPGNQAKKNAVKFKELGDNPAIMVKDIRTNYSTEMAKDSLVKDYDPEYLANLTEAQFKKVREEVGVKVGTALGHWKTADTKDAAGKKILDENDKPIKELVNKGGEALKSYIDPAIFDEIKPKTDIQNAHTPDWHEKTPLEERDIDEYAEARRRKGENRQWGIREFGGQRKPLVKTWIQSLTEQGFYAPVIKQANAGQLWFLNNGIDYVGTLGMLGDVFVEKATFKPTFNNPGISYNPSGRNKDVKTREPRKDVETLNFDESDDF